MRPGRSNPETESCSSLSHNAVIIGRAALSHQVLRTGRAGRVCLVHELVPESSMLHGTQKVLSRVLKIY
jgi:hypothetical protein